MLDNAMGDGCACLREHNASTPSGRAAQRREIAEALSQTIRGLEARLGVRLFDRTTRSVRLTPAGSRLLARVEPAMDEVGAAIADTERLGDAPAGRLRIHAFRLASRMFLAPVFRVFADAYPDIVPDVTLDDRPVELVAEGFDVAIRLGELLEQDMVAVRLGAKLRQIAVASPDYVKRHGKPDKPSDLHAHRCINWRWPGQIHPYRWEFKNEEDWFRVAVHGPLIVNDQAVAIHAAVDGIGIGFWAENEVVDRIKAGELVPLLEDWCAPFDGFYLCYPRQRHPLPALRAFVDFLKQRCGS